LKKALISIGNMVLGIGPSTEFSIWELESDGKPCAIAIYLSSRENRFKGQNFRFGNWAYNLLDLDLNIQLEKCFRQVLNIKLNLNFQARHLGLGRL